jgi:DNA-binding NarL/FixJ family response regulator
MKRRAHLTRREWQILALVAEGWHNREIAGHLHVSPHTVKSHLDMIYLTLQVKNRAAAAAYYARHGRGWMFAGDLIVR